MAEQLIIRLGSQANEVIHWLIWSPTEQGIIGSGEVSGAQQLLSLQEKSISRQVVILVPGADVALKRLHVPAKSKKAMQLAAPYMLEDELAQEVEQLFFAYGDVNQPSDEDNCFIAVVTREQMHLWLSWLSAAGIEAKRMLPDVLALPSIKNDDQRWQAIQLKQQVIVRQGAWAGAVIDESLWSTVSELWSAKQEVKIDAYSLLPEMTTAIDVDNKPEELPLALFAQHLPQQSFNLLQGDFKVKSQRSPTLKTWAWAAGFIFCALLLNVVMKSLTLMKINEQQAAIEQQIIETYKSAFPETQRVRISTIRSQLKRKLAEVGSSSSDGDFLDLLVQIQPAFAKVPSLKPDSIKYDINRNELRLQATAKGYQQFEQFKVLLESKQLSVSQGAQNSQGDEVSGSFSITQKTGGQS